MFIFTWKKTEEIQPLEKEIKNGYKKKTQNDDMRIFSQEE